MTIFADANKGSIAAGLEDSTVYGALPAEAGYLAPELTYARMTGETLMYKKQVVQSNEIRSDRNVIDHIEVGADVSGDINAELSFATFDDWFYTLLTPNGAAAANGTDPVAATIAGVSIADTDISVTDTNTIHRVSGSFITAGLVVGMWIKVAGFTDPANNGLFQLATVAANDIDVTVNTLAAEIAGDAVTIKGKMFRNGTNLVLGVGGSPIPAMVFEKHYTDLTTTFEHYTGCRFNQLAVNVNAQQILTMTWSVMGKTMGQSVATISSAAVVAANTNTIMNATSNVILLEEGGVTLTTPVSAVSFTIKNNLRQLNQVGSKFPFEQGTGWFQVEGKLTAYFESQTLRNKMINHTASALRLRLTDASGNSIVFTIPALRFLQGAPSIVGANQNVMVDLDFAAYYDSTTKAQFQMDMLSV